MMTTMSSYWLMVMADACVALMEIDSASVTWELSADGLMTILNSSDMSDEVFLLFVDGTLDSERE